MRKFIFICALAIASFSVTAQQRTIREATAAEAAARTAHGVYISPAQLSGISGNTNALTPAQQQVVTNVTVLQAGTGVTLQPVSTNTASGIRTVTYAVNATNTYDLTNSGSLYVDIAGNNSTGQRLRPNKPFLTISNAFKSSRAGDTIYVRPGTYNDAGLIRSNVNFYFEPGAKINYTSGLNVPIFGDTLDPLAVSTGIATTNRIMGYGEFANEWTSDGSAAPNSFALLALQNSNSVFYLAGNSFTHTNQELDSSGVFCFNAKYFNLHLNLIDYYQVLQGDVSSESAVMWFAGRADMYVDTLKVGGGVSGVGIYDPGDDSNSDVLTFHCNYLDARNTSEDCLWWYGSNNTNQQQFFFIDDMEAGTGAAILSLVGGGGKIYVQGNGKTSNHSAVSPVIHFANAQVRNQFWMNSQKVACAGVNNVSAGLVRFTGNPSGNLTNKADVTFNVDEWQILGTNFQTAWKLEYGTYVFNGCKPTVIPNGRGFVISDSKVTLNNMIIDCSAKAGFTNNPIFITNSCSLTMNNCTLIAAAGVPCITSTVPVTVTMLGGATFGPISANVTMSGYWMSNNVYITR